MDLIYTGHFTCTINAKNMVLRKNFWMAKEKNYIECLALIKLSKFKKGRYFLLYKKKKEGNFLQFSIRK